MSTLIKVAKYLLSVLVFVKYSECLKFPDDIRRCKPSDVNCIGQSSAEFIKNSQKGRQDIGVPKLDPFVINQLVISQATGGPVDLELKLKDVEVNGLSHMKFERVVGFDRNATTSKFELYGMVPKLRVKGNYKINGHFSLLLIEGNGEMDINMENIKLDIKFKPSVTSTSDDKQHLKVDKLKLRIDPSKINIKLTNLYNGDSALGDNTNRFLNENWRSVWEDISPSVNEAVANVVKRIINSLCERFNYEELLIMDN